MYCVALDKITQMFTVWQEKTLNAIYHQCTPSLLVRYYILYIMKDMIKQKNNSISFVYFHKHGNQVNPYLYKPIGLRFCNIQTPLSKRSIAISIVFCTICKCEVIKRNTKHVCTSFHKEDQTKKIKSVVKGKNTMCCQKT